MLKFLRVWQHGFIISLVIGLGGLMAVVYAAMFWVPIMIVLEVLGRPAPADFWFKLTWALMLPLGIGLAARYVDFDELKADDYPEPDGGTAKALKQAKRRQGLGLD